MKYTIIIDQSEDDKIWVASVVEVPGCLSQGKDSQEACERIGEALALCIELAESESAK